MKGLKIPGLLIFLASICISDAQPVNYLKYKFMEIKKGKQVENGGIEFFVNGEMLRAKKTYEKYPLPQKTFDRANKVVVFDFQEQHEYIIEELDSLYRINSRVVPTGEKETVEGYNCEKYTVGARLSVNVALGRYDQHGPQISNTGYGQEISNTGHSYTIWVTSDIKGDETLCPFISSCLTGNVARFTYSGVIVKIESMGGSTVLDNKTIDAVQDKEYILPWKSSQQYVAVLPQNPETRSGILPALIYTSESFTAYFKRMKALLIKITGIENPKSKIRPMSISAQ